MRFKIEQFEETETFSRPEKPWRVYFPGWPGKCPFDSKNFKTRQEARDYGKLCLLKFSLNNDSKVIAALGGLEPVRAAADTGVENMDQGQYEKLFEIYQLEMPYGTQKARYGDPFQFINDKLNDLASRLVSKEED